MQGAPARIERFTFSDQLDAPPIGLLTGKQDHFDAGWNNPGTSAIVTETAENRLTAPQRGARYVAADINPSPLTDSPHKSTSFDALPVGSRLNETSGQFESAAAYHPEAQNDVPPEIEESRTADPIPAAIDVSPATPQAHTAAHEEKATTPKQWPAGGLKYEAPMPPAPPDLRSLVTRFVLATAAVLIACVACLWLARRWLSQNVPTGKADGRMKLVATVNLSSRSSLQLVDIEGQKVLVGSDASGIKTVTPLTESFLDNFQQAASNSR